MRSNFKKSLGSALCFVFFMILAAGSGCEGCGGRSYNYTSDEDNEVTDTIAEEVEPETPQRELDEENYSSDIEEEEREEEEIFQSETEDDVEGNNDEENKVDSIKFDSDVEI
jgi:predicted  nucleic acid-binding Zn-ribbon protein